MATASWMGCTGATIPRPHTSIGDVPPVMFEEAHHHPTRGHATTTLRRAPGRFTLALAWPHLPVGSMPSSDPGRFTPTPITP